MTIDSLIMLSGAFVAVLPFLGFPNSWDGVFFFLAGIFVISLGIVVRRRGRNLSIGGGTGGNPHFIENMPVESSRAQGHEEN